MSEWLRYLYAQGIRKTWTFHLVYLTGNCNSRHQCLATLCQESIFKMASADRREARRRKLLQNSELRLGKILGSRSSHPTAPHEPEKTLVKSIDLEKRGDEGQSNEVPLGRGFLFDKSELPSEYQSIKSGFTTGSEESTEPITEAMKEKRNSLESKLDYLTEDSTTRSTNLLSSPGEDQTGDKGAPSSISKRLRVLLNVTLAFLLVVKWAYINLEALHSAAASSQQSPASSQKYLIYSEVRKL